MKLIRMISMCCCCAVITASRREVYQNSYIKWSEAMLANNDFTKDLALVDVTKGSRHRRSAYADIGACPNFTAEYLSNATKDMQRSTSPWRYYINFDNNRIPQMIVDARCLCRGCIDLTTGVEDQSRTASVGIYSNIEVLRFNQRFYHQIQTGCTCVFKRDVPAGK